MGKSIENFLGLTKKEIDKRKSELKEKIPTLPGTAYLELKLKEFSVQPWPFISYLAYWNPEQLGEALSCYKDYDGSENYHAVLEGLKEEYIICQVLLELRGQNKTK